MKLLYCTMLLALCSIHVMSQVQDVSPAGVMISHGHPKGGFMLSYTYMHMGMKDNLSGTEKITDQEIFLKNYSMSPQEMNMDMHMIMGMYGLTGRLSFMAMASYNHSTMEMKSYSSGHIHGGAAPSLYHTHNTSGFGDIKLWALYKLLNGESSSLVFSAGVNIPTGDYNVLAGEHATFPGQKESYMMQLGTGSPDLMPGLTYYKSGKKIAWSAQALATLRPFDNSEDYHYGSDVTANLWGAYLFNSRFSASLRTELFYGGEIAGSDSMIYPLSEPGANPENYGGTKASAYAGLNFYITKSFMRDSKLGLEAGLPFYQNVNGIQMATQYILNATLTKSF